MPSQNDLGRAQAEYNTLRARLEPRLQKLKQVGDHHAKEMHRLFDAAAQAWDEDDRAAAKALSERGHAEKKQSEEANADANALRKELSFSLQALKGARHAVHSQGTGAPARAPQDRDHLANAGVEMIGFDDEPRWRSILNTLPPAGFREIRRIEYIDEPRPDAAEGEVVNRFSPGQSTEIKVYRNPLDLDTRALRYSRAWTLIHEYAHVVFDRCVPVKDQEAWGRLHNNHRLGKHDGAWITPRAKVSLREDFCECFSAYAIAPTRLANADPERYRVMKKIVEAL